MKNCARFLTFLIALVFLVEGAICQVDDQKARIAQNDADTLYYDSKIEDAILKYKQLLETYPNYESKKSVMTMLGRCYSKLGNDSLAVQSFREVIDADPNDSYASQAVSLMGNLFRQRYQYKEAVLVCQQVVKKHPKTLAASMAMYLIPTYLYYDGKIDQAIDGYKKFIDEFPTSTFRSSAFSSLVSIYISKGKFDEAERLILQKMRISPNDTDLMQELASVYQRRGKHQEALKLYQSALTRNPNNTDLLRKMGELYVQIGEKQKAIKMWSGISSGRNDYYRHQQLAYTYKQHGFYEEAIKEYEQAIKLQPKSSYLYTQLADVYKIQGQIDKIIDVYLNALIKLGISYSGRSSILSDLDELFDGEQKQKLFSNVIAKIQGTLANDPNSSVIWLTLAEIQFYQGDYGQSLKSFKRLAELYPNDRGRFFENYGKTLDSEKDPYALEFYKAIEEKFPTSPYRSRVQMSRAVLNYKLSRWDSALAVLKNITQRSRNLEAYLLMGEVQLYGLRDVEGAKITYGKARLFGAVRALEIQLRLSECELLLGNYDKAKQALDQIATHSIEARKLLSDLYFYQGDFESAKEEYQKVVNIALNDELTNDAIVQLALIDANSDYFSQPLSMYAQARRLELSGNMVEAIEMYQSILKQFPQSTMVGDATLAIARLHLTAGKINEAVAMYEKIIESASPFAAEAQAKIADIYLENLGEQDQALKAYSKLIEKYPDSVFTTYARKKIESVD